VVLVVGCERVIVHDITLGAYNTNKFLEFVQTKVIPSLDRQRFILMDNIPFHRFYEIQQAFEDATHIYFHLPSFSPLGPFLNGVEWLFGHIKSHIWHNDLQNH